MPSWTIAIGCDDAGSEYKAALHSLLEKDSRVKSVIDCGMDKVYPHVGVAVARKVAGGEADRGLLICGTGMGVAIAANKVAGIRVSIVLSSFRWLTAVGARLTRLRWLTHRHARHTTRSRSND